MNSIPRHLRQSGSKNTTSLGITTLALSKENSTEFIIGTETGYVLKCNTNAFMSVSPKKVVGN